MSRTGRRPGANTTRASILEVARRRFAEAGYEATSMRAIAAEAGVDPAVVVHFAGPGAEGIGARVALTFFDFWEDPTIRPSLLALLRSAMSHETSAALLREFVTQELFTQVANMLSGPSTRLRVNLASAHLIGVAVMRYGLYVEPIASLSKADLVVWLTPALNGYLDATAEGKNRTSSEH
jgi:Tetracyclin repressor-like, C-terminal domain/Bacterial regulatory proteins, tetR family